VFIPRLLQPIATEFPPTGTSKTHCSACGNRRYWLGIEDDLDLVVNPDSVWAPSHVASQRFETALDGGILAMEPIVSANPAQKRGVIVYTRIVCDAGDCTRILGVYPFSPISIGIAAADMLLRESEKEVLAPTDTGELLLATFSSMAYASNNIQFFVDKVLATGQIIEIPVSVLSRCLQQRNPRVRSALVTHLSLLKPFLTHSGRRRRGAARSGRASGVR